jgi:hypothetical protein
MANPFNHTPPQNPSTRKNKIGKCQIVGTDCDCENCRLTLQQRKIKLVIYGEIYMKHGINCSYTKKQCELIK